MPERSIPLRKRLFIDRAFQGRFILAFSLLAITGTVLFAVVAYVILNRSLGDNLFSAHLAISRTGEMLTPTLTALSIAFALILGIASATLSLYVSHRISGPLFAITRYLGMMAEGKLNFEAKLRTNDQTCVVAESLNTTVGFLRGRLRRTRESAAQLRQGLDRLSESVKETKSGGEAALAAVSQMDARLRAIEEDLGAFDLG